MANQALSPKHGSVCHGLCGAQPAPSRPAAKRYVMPTIEKHNGLWFEDESSGQLVFEEYAADLDLIGAVYRKK